MTALRMRMRLRGGGQRGDMPCYTNNFSGNCVYSDAMCTQIVVRTPLAIHFSSQYSHIASGGSIDLKGLARALHNTGKKRFTIEVFWRSSESRDLAPLVSFHDRFRGRLATGSYDNYIALYNRTASSEYKLGDYDYLRYQGWRHWALTVDATSDSTGVGCIYYDYVKMGEKTDFVLTSDGCADIRLGATLWDSAGTREGGNCVRGDMTCIRVSDDVLAPDQFMRMGVAAFYPFGDGAAGTEVGTVTNSIVAGDATGTAGAANKMPMFSSDRPGRYIFSSADKHELIGSDIQSIDFGMKDAYTQSHGFIDMAGLAGRLMMVSRPHNGFTIEFFFKRESVGWGNLHALAMEAPVGDRIGVRVNSADVLEDTRYSYESSRKSTTCSNSGESFLNDGRWHHVAMVVGQTSASQVQYRGVSIFLDYFQDAASVPGWIQYRAGGSRWEAWNDAPLTLGHYVNHLADKNGFIGKIAALRVTSKELTPDRFMVASDTLDEPASETLFRWRFEEGAKDAPVTTVASSDNTETWASGGVTSFGSGAVAPLFSALRVAGRVKLGETMFEDRRSIATVASDATRGVALENKTWCGLPCLHPKSWTMEVFVKSDSSVRASEAVLVGRGRIDPGAGTARSDWALALQPDGKLALKGYRTGESAIAFAYSDLGTTIDDGRWHRVEVTYDGDANRCNVWLDDARILDQVLESALVDSLDARYQFASGGGFCGFGGLMDEIRFVGRVLNPDEFAVPSPSGLIFVFR